MVVNLLFFSEVGDWPDSKLEDLFKQGVERSQAIDYHIVEREGLSQREWARRVGKTQQTVSTNVRRAKEILNE
jgi:transcriptional regulator